MVVLYTLMVVLKMSQLMVILKVMVLKGQAVQYLSEVNQGTVLSPLNSMTIVQDKQVVEEYFSVI